MWIQVNKETENLKSYPKNKVKQKFKYFVEKKIYMKKRDREVGNKVRKVKSIDAV